MTLQTNTAHGGDAAFARDSESDASLFPQQLCSQRGWRAQFGHPQGLLGRLAGRLMAVNSYQHWPEQGRSLAEVRRVLAPGGTLLLALRVHEPPGGRFQSPGFTPEQIDAVRRQVEAAAFENVRLAQRKAGRRVTFVAASRSGEGA